MHSLPASLLVLVLAACSLPHGATAADEQNVTTAIVATGKPLAIHGYDPVAYFTVGTPTRGSAKFAFVQGEVTYYFASQANLDAFKADPVKYEPAYGGFCAFGASVGKKFDGDPRIFTIKDGRLFLNLNEDIAQKFNADVDGAVKKADEQWKRIKSAPVRSL